MVWPARRGLYQRLQRAPIVKRFARPVAALAASAAPLSPFALTAGATASASPAAARAAASCTLSPAGRAAVLDRLALLH
jgi:hypothetical protein